MFICFEAELALEFVSRISAVEVIARRYELGLTGSYEVMCDMHSARWTRNFDWVLVDTWIMFEGKEAEHTKFETELALSTVPYLSELAFSEESDGSTHIQFRLCCEDLVLMRLWIRHRQRERGCVICGGLAE